jgi:membrane-associated protease RseP (regulator of RpoE activity)
LPEERPAIRAWIESTRRDPHPRRLVWEGAAPGRVRWLVVTQLGDAAKEIDFPDVNPKLPPGRPRIGVMIEPEFEGPGVKLKEVEEGMPAAKLGLKVGDILVGFDGTDVGTMQDLARGLRAKRPGDGFRIRFRRGEETLEKEGVFPEARAEPALRRERPYGTLEAEVKEGVVEVRARGIRAFEILLAEPLFDLSKPVVVSVNGEIVHSGVVAPDLRFLAEQAAADGDRATVYLARLRIALPGR